jgi:hypothetical protein
VNPITPEPSPDARVYQIRLEGHLDDHWAEWFDGLLLSRQTGGITVLAGPVPDQAALHALLRKVRDLGLPLLSVIQVYPQTYTRCIDNKG